MTKRDRRKKINAENKIYISEKLKDKFDKITGYPLTSIEAPLGYGKSVSFVNYLRESGILYLWQDVQSNDLTVIFEQFCELISRLDENAGQELREQVNGFSEDKDIRILHILGKLDLKEHVVIVLDNMQMALEAAHGFFEKAARVNIPYLHFVIIGRRKFTKNREELRMKHLLHSIDVFDFMMDTSDIVKYFSMCGIELSTGLADSLRRRTDGWIAALYLIILRYAETGTGFDIPEQIMGIFSQTVCADYTDDQIDFLERISVFDDFSMEQARFVRRKKDPEQILIKLAEDGDFIWIDPKSGNYHIHRLFSRYFREKAEQKGLKFKNEIYRQAADWYYLNRNYGRASYCYYRSGNFEDTLRSFELDKGQFLCAGDIDTMKSIFAECPEKVRDHHYTALMIYARQLRLHGDDDGLDRVMALLDSGEYRASLPEGERETFAGEYQMLCSFLYYRDLSSVEAYQLRCSRRLRQRVSQTGRMSDFTFGVPSVLFLYYTKPGSLDSQLERFSSTRDMYYHLTDNNGRGSEYLFEAEIRFMRGDIERADILSHKAGTVAEKYGQSGIGMIAWFIQSKIALLRGETERGIECMENINEVIKNTGRRYLKFTGDLCEASVYSVFNQLERAAEWICSGEFRIYGRHMLYKPAIDYASIIYSRILIDNFEYSKFLGVVDDLLKDAADNSNVLAQIYYWIYKAISYRRLSMTDEAKRSIHTAIDLAMEDGIIMPFTENGRELNELYRKARLNDEERDFIEKCNSFFRKHEKHLNVILIADTDSAISMLTRREQEISKLVAQGKTNLEIARELNIAEITVKKSLSNVYSRLGIPNRAALIKKMVQ